MFKPEYVTLVDMMGDDLRVANSARVSFAKESEWEYDVSFNGMGDQVVKNIGLSEKDKKLINYLAEHNHFSPFTHAIITLRIKMPIFIERQWFKSSVGFSRNSVSRRYVSDAPEFWTPTEWRKAATNKKQGSSDEVIPINDIRACFDHQWGIELDDLYQLSLDYYNSAIEKGVAPELARMILPQSMITEFIETASLAAYARLVKLRITPDAQKEIRDYAHAVSEIMCELFPVSWKALMEN